MPAPGSRGLQALVSGHPQQRRMPSTCYLPGPLPSERPAPTFSARVPGPPSPPRRCLGAPSPGLRRGLPPGAGVGARAPASLPIYRPELSQVIEARSETQKLTHSPRPDSPFIGSSSGVPNSSNDVSETEGDRAPSGGLGEAWGGGSGLQEGAASWGAAPTARPSLPARRAVPMPVQPTPRPRFVLRGAGSASAARSPT
ncbi:unnamed protein product [Rangifer tarandus platyrhynchus]|uniref:Uncharacterized protein n=1 Tax=Rangifer tarandus platyrhynchus TaxID=3082113 RepID=A0AC59YRN6_RANTA